MKESGSHGAAAMPIAQAMQVAARAYSGGDWAEAEKWCRQILAARGDYLDALNLLGIIAAQTRRLDEAARLLGHVAGANPGQAVAQNNYGNVLKDLKRFDAALESYERALKINPSYAEARNNRGNALKELRRLDEALASYDQALTLRPDYAEACNNRGIVLQELKRREEALASYEQALRLKPDYVEALNNRGNALKELRRLDQALASYDRALTLRPDYAEALNNRGIVLQELKRLHEALASYDRALALRPDHPETLHNRGSVLQELGRLDEALVCYEQVLARERNHPKTLNNRGNALQELKRFDDALVSYDWALALEPNYAEALNNRGNALQELNRFDEALVSYDRALALTPDSAAGLNNRGNALKAMKRLDEALASYEQALVLRPNYAEALYNRGNTLQELTRLDEALASYDQALALNPEILGDFTAFERLGSSFYQLGRYDRAAGVYRRWRELDPANATAQHMYAAASGDSVPHRASAQYVTSLFDRFADSFDSTLERLDYAAPRLLYEALVKEVDCGRDGLAVLDAGCGTGLCGVLMRSLAKFLAGVDLSARMLARARALNLYDELSEGELCAFMASRPQEFDVVICADTLIYFGALEEPVMAAHRCLRPGGVFAFTVETLPADSSTPSGISAHGRYTHTAGYVLKTLQASGFSDIECSSVVLRKEFGNDVKGYLVTCRTPTISGMACSGDRVL